jgi:hypothetical protein
MSSTTPDLLLEAQRDEHQRRNASEYRRCARQLIEHIQTYNATVPPGQEFLQTETPVLLQEALDEYAVAASKVPAPHEGLEKLAAAIGKLLALLPEALPVALSSSAQKDNP